MKTITKPQISKIHVLLNQLGLMDSKVEIISNFSNGRTTSTKGLYFDEAKRLIISLADYSPKERTKSLIFSLAYQSGIIYGDTPEDKKMNAAKLNIFLKERGAVKKELNQMSQDELNKTHRQFEAVVKQVKSSKDKKQADKSVNELLGELNIQVTENQSKH